jgi:gamma-glutamyltranspeptidase/glutathione hydrolase
MALERYGTMPLDVVLAPAIELAERGVPVTWHTTLTMARDLANLRRFPETAATYLAGGEVPPVTADTLRPAIMRNPALAQTLRTIATDGPRSFYEGEIATIIVGHLAANGTPIEQDDFVSYEAIEAIPITRAFHGHTIHTVGKGSGGTSLSQALGILGHLELPANGHNTSESLHKLAFAFRQAFADRYTYLADPDQVEVPLNHLLNETYLRSRAATFEPDRAVPPTPGTREQLGVRHTLAGSVPEYMRDGSTTHLGVIDRDGNAVSITQTLLSLWGSRVVVPGTGVLMNNGMMWFDPEPGRPNSVGPRKRPLSNMAPALVTRNNEVVASIGSSGGRKIMNCNAQIVANLTRHGLAMGEALAAPRIDASTRALLASTRIDARTLDALRSLGYPVQPVDESLIVSTFASPVAIGRDQDGLLEAAADAWYYPATAMAIG